MTSVSFDGKDVFLGEVGGHVRTGESAAGQSRGEQATMNLAISSQSVMPVALIRAATGLVAGAVAGAVGLTAMVALTPGVAIEMDGDARTVISGLHGPERVGDETYAWTRGDATLRLPGLDRRAEWTCSIRLRGGRPDASTLPVVTVAVDGVIAKIVQSTNDYQDAVISVPPRPGTDGAIVTVAASNTFVPGPADTRTLGVMIDRWACQPAAGQFVWPPARSLSAAAAAGAVFGLAAALLTIGVLAPAIAICALAVAQGVPLAAGFGRFTAYPNQVMGLAVAIALLMVLITAFVERWRGARLTPCARFVAVFVGAVLFLKLIALLHPSKPPVDVIFHAHRLQWVLDGRFYFTQPMPSGVRFPYAIGLYVFAAPWTLLTTDFVLLLRIIVSAAELCGSVLLYLMVVRLWNDRLAGAFSAALLPFVPRLFEIAGYANMTNAFGQSAALATVAAAVLWPLDRAHRGRVVAFAAIAAFALLCHISTLTLLFVVLLAMAALFWWKGGQALRQTARYMCAAVLVASLFAVVVYYGHFGDAYRSAARVRAAPAAAAQSTAAPATVTLAAKLGAAADLSVDAVGWPMLLLAVPGAVWVRGRRDRLSLAVAAWVLTFAVFVAGVVFAPVERSFQRYAAEFISRVTLATHPAVVILAGAGAAGLWRRSVAGRVVAVVLLCGIAYSAIAAWMAWVGW